MTAPACFSYTIYQGATFRRGFRWCTVSYPTKIHCGKLVRADNGQPVPDADMVPVDLAGCTARMQLRSEVLSPDVLLEMSTEDGRIDLSAGDGWVHIVLDAATTGGIPYGDQPPAKWSGAIGQLEIVHPNGDVTRVAEISWSVAPEGTR
ncbi:MAG: hypothetical protein RSD57_15890 [Comamonas sp.]